MNSPASQGTSATSRDELISSHLPLVGYVVNEIASRVPPHVSRDDLTGAGLIGLVQAADAFDASRGVPFNRYASTRIRGAIVDELRSGDWVSRSVRSRARQREEAAEQLAATLGRIPTQQELANFMGVPLSHLEAVDGDLQRAVVLRIDAESESGTLESILPSAELTPEDQLLKREQIGYLHSAIEALPDRLRTVISMYFLEGKPMADIAADLQVTESRVSQMRAEAIALLRDGMNSQLDPELVSTSGKPGGCVERRKASYYRAIAERSSFAGRLAPLAEEAVPTQRGAALA